MAPAPGDASTREGTYRLLVSVGDPAQVNQLMRTAVDVARDRGGSIHVVAVILRSRDSPFAVLSDETVKREYGGDRRAVLDRAVEAASGTGVPVSGELRVGNDLSRAIIEAHRDLDADAALIGWAERARTDVVFGSNVDRVVDRTPGDVLVEKIGVTADPVDSILVPARGGTHAHLAAEVARAIAAANDARIEVVGVDDGTGVVTDPAALAEGPDAPLAGVPDVTLSSRAGDVVDTVVALAADHDIVVLGAPPQGLLSRLVVEAVPREVGRRVDCTVIMARRNPRRSSRLDRVRRRLSR